MQMLVVHWPKCARDFSENNAPMMEALKEFVLCTYFEMHIFINEFFIFTGVLVLTEFS